MLLDCEIVYNKRDSVTLLFKVVEMQGIHEVISICVNYILTCGSTQVKKLLSLDAKAINYILVLLFYPICGFESLREVERLEGITRNKLYSFLKRTSQHINWIELLNEISLNLFFPRLSRIQTRFCITSEQTSRQAFCR